MRLWVRLYHANTPQEFFLEIQSRPQPHEHPLQSLHPSSPHNKNLWLEQDVKASKHLDKMGRVGKWSKHLFVYNQQVLHGCIQLTTQKLQQCAPVTPKAGHPTGIVLAQYLQFMGCVEETVKQLQYVLFPGICRVILTQFAIVIARKFHH